MEKQINTPTLRFPLFTEGWVRKKLGEIIEFKAGYAFKSELMLSKKSNYQLLKMSNVYQNELRLDRHSSYWAKIDTKQKEFLLKKGDTILTLTGTVGKQDYGYSVQIKEDNKYLLNQRLVLLRELENKSDNDFISQIISNEKFLFYFFAEAKGGTGNQTNVSTEAIKNIELLLPNIEEQQKIATFFTAIDAKLSGLKQKRTLLTQYKKGVMQQLFSQALRFKNREGGDFEEWEVKKLGEVLVEPKQIAEEKPNKIELITVKLHCKGIENTGNFPVVTRNGRPYFRRFKNEILIGRQNFHNGGIGIVKEENHGKICSNAISSYNVKNDNLLYIYYYISIPEYYTKINDLIGGTGQKEISKSEFGKLEIQIPCITEQTQIANYLSAIDAKIQGVTGQIEKMETWKKGLLQNMFV